MGSKPTWTSWTKLVGPEVPSEDRCNKLPKSQLWVYILFKSERQGIWFTYVVDFVHPRIHFLIIFARDVVCLVFCYNLETEWFQIGTRYRVDLLQEYESNALSSLLKKNTSIDKDHQHVLVIGCHCHQIFQFQMSCYLVPMESQSLIS